VLNGSSAQTISGKSIYISNLTVNNTAGATIAGGDTLKVYGVYTPAAGVLAADGYLLLASNAAGTASVAQGYGQRHCAALYTRPPGMAVADSPTEQHRQPLQ
jgi:hypothetical protein